MVEAKWQFRDFFSGKEALYLWAAALAIFMLGIWQQPFINFETRFAVFAQEMLRNGLTLFPTSYGQPYPDYPVTSTALIWLFSLPFGQVTKFSAVLPTALASATVVALTYQLFAQYSRRWGLLAVGFEFLTATFLAESRSISVDQMVSAITLSAFYLTHKSYRNGLALPTIRLVLLLIAGFLIRGPIGVVIPAGVVLSHLLLTSERRAVVSFAAWSSGVLITCSAMLLGLAMFIYGKDFVGDIVRMQAFSRFAESAPSPGYYYLTSSFGNYALSYPIAVMVAALMLLNKLRKRSSVSNRANTVFIELLMAWTVILLVGLSIPETKKVRYILPVVPALAGLASYVFIDTEYSLMKWLRRCVQLVLLFLPFLAAVLLYTQKARLGHYGLNLHFLMAAFFLLFIINVSIFIRQKNRKSDMSMQLLFVGVLSAICFHLAIVEPIDLSIHDTSGFVRRIESLREEKPGELVFYKENPDGLPIKYLVNARVDLLPKFISDLEFLRNNHSPIWLLTRERNIDDLVNAGIDRKSVIYHEKFGELPFLAVFIPASSVTPKSPEQVAP